jgi:hypothetical protein
LLISIITSCRKQSGVEVPGTDTLAQSFYQVSRSASATTAGTILLGPNRPNVPYDSSMLMIMDGSGHLLRSHATGAATLDFKKWTIGNLTRYTWFEYQQSLFDPATGGYQQGYIMVADENLQPIRRIDLLPFGGITDVSHQNLDGHDFILLGSDHYIAMAYARRMVDNVPLSFGTGGKAYVATPVIQEVQNGQVIWQWEASDFPEFYTTSVEGNNYANQSALQDYMHMNSMSIDSSDGGLICSFRNCDQVVKINRKTGDIIWRLGGKNSDFALSDDMKFLRQHHATLTDGGHTLLIFDNGDAKLRPYSRILELQLSTETGLVSSYKAFRIPEPFTQFMGSVQKIGRHYFIGGGSAGYVLDVNYTTGEKVLELKSSGSTYRAFKY